MVSKNTVPPTVFQAYFNTLPKPAFMCRPDGTVIDVNQLGLGLLRLSRTKVVNHQFDRWFGPALDIKLSKYLYTESQQQKGGYYYLRNHPSRTFFIHRQKVISDLICYTINPPPLPLISPTPLLNRVFLRSTVLIQHGQIVYADRKLLRLTGYSVAELNRMGLTESIKTLFTAADSTKILATQNKDYHPADPWKVQVELIHKNGHHRWVDIFAQKIVYQEQDTIQVVLVDITAQKHTEEALKKSENMYRAIFESTHTGMFICDASTIIRYTNRQFAKLIGRPKSAIEGKMSWVSLVSPEQKRRLLEMSQRLRNHRPLKNFIFNPIDANGHQHLTIASVNLIPHSNLGIISCMDITDKMKTEALVKQSEVRLKVVLENSPFGMIVVNETGVVEAISRTAAKLFGIAVKKIEKVPLNELIDQHIFPPEFANLPSGKKVRNYEQLAFQAGNATRWFHVSIAKIMAISHSPAYWMIWFQEVSDTVWANQLASDLPGLIMDAHEEEKQLLSQEVHDTLIQSLAVLKLNLKQLQSEAKRQMGDVSQLKPLDSMMNQVNELIEESRNLAANLRPDIVDKLGLVAAIENLTRETEQRYGVVTQFSTTCASIEIPSADTLQLYRIVQESLTNAAKHSQASTIKVHLTHDGPRLKIAIRDNGTGFDLYEIENSRSTITKKTGLGMKIMRERTKRIGAILTIFSRSGKGSVVTITYPTTHSNHDLSISQEAV